MTIVGLNSLELNGAEIGSDVYGVRLTTVEVGDTGGATEEKYVVYKTRLFGVDVIVRKNYILTTPITATHFDYLFVNREEAERKADELNRELTE